jgi:hypothetical protein
MRDEMALVSLALHCFGANFLCFIYAFWNALEIPRVERGFARSIGDEERII